MLPDSKVLIIILKIFRQGNNLTRLAVVGSDDEQCIRVSFSELPADLHCLVKGV